MNFRLIFLIVVVLKSFLTYIHVLLFDSGEG